MWRLALVLLAVWAPVALCHDRGDQRPADLDLTVPYTRIGGFRKLLTSGHAGGAAWGAVDALQSAARAHAHPGGVGRLLLAPPGPALRPAAPEFPDQAANVCPGPLVVGKELVIASTCTLTSLPPKLDTPGARMQGLQIRNGTDPGQLPLLLMPEGPGQAAPKVAVQPAALLELVHLVFRSGGGSENADSLAKLVVPSFVSLLPGAELSMVDCGKVIAVPAAAAAELFARVLAAPELVQAMREWRFVIYTDRTTWLHVHWFSSNGITLRSFGVVNAPGPLGPSSSSDGFALDASNATIVGLLQQYATVETPDPFLMYVVDNCTLWPRSDWPHAGIAFRRPVVLVGWAAIPTSIDLGNCVSCASLTGRWSNVTFDSVILENLGYGDPASAASDRYSVISAQNLWFFNATRLEPRISMRNVTLVLPLAREVDMRRYWSGVFNSPEQSAWLRAPAGLNITAWEVSVDSPDSLTYNKYVAPLMYAQNTVLTAIPRVFPKRPIPGWDNHHVAGFYKSHLPIPRVEYCNNPAELMEGRQVSLNRPLVCLLTNSSVNLGPDPSMPWPPAGGYVIEAETFLILHGHHSHEGAARARDGARRRLALHDAGADSAVQAEESRRLAPPDADHAHLEGLRPNVSLALGYAPSVFSIEYTPNRDGGVVDIEMVRMVQLAQGPGALTAVSLEEPSVWTLILWAFHRTVANGLTLDEVELVVPGPEFEEVKRQRGNAETFSIYLQGAVMTFVNSRFLDPARTRLFAERFDGHMVTGTNVVFTTDADPLTAMPPGYVWPASGDVSRRGGVGGLSPAANKGLFAAIAVTAVAAAALLVVLVIAAARRRRRLRAAAAESAKALQIGVGSGGTGSDGNGSGNGGGPANGGGHADGNPWAAAPEGARKCSATSCSVCHGGTASSEDPGSGADAFYSGDPTTSRWRQLLLAINVRVADIHAKRLAATLNPPPGGPISGSGSGSEPLPALHRSSGAAGGAAAAALVPASALSATLQQRRSYQPWEVPDTSPAAALVALGVAGGNSYTVGRSANSFRSAASGTRGTAPRHGQPQQLQLIETLGSGTFGTVFRARWHGAEVAVKLVQLPTTLLGGGGAAAAAAGGQEPAGPASGSGGAADGDAAAAQQAAAFASARERMAIQEAAISTTMAHPSIVALYCIGLRPVYACGAPTEDGCIVEDGPADEPAGPLMGLRDGSSGAAGSGGRGAGAEAGAAAGGGGEAAAGVVVAWEMQLIMEYCDQGTLRRALDSGRLQDPATGLTRLPVAASLAHQVASAMQYLHEESILHGDLKPSNVLLKSQAAAPPAPPLFSPPAPLSAPLAPAVSQPLTPAGPDLDALSAKVSDFGLSWSMDASDTHVSSCHAGTMTHMSPELLLEGKASKASDVYAFGMLLWELATGGRAFTGVPRPLLGHAIVQQRLRPMWPPPAVGPAWGRLRDLTERCWAHDAAMRPSFLEVVEELEAVQTLLALDPAGCQLPAAAAAAAHPGWRQQPGWQCLQTPDGCESRELDNTSSRLANLAARHAAFEAAGDGGPPPLPPPGELELQPLAPQLQYLHHHPQRLQPQLTAQEPGGVPGVGWPAGSVLQLLQVQGAAGPGLPLAPLAAVPGPGAQLPVRCPQSPVGTTIPPLPLPPPHGLAARPLPQHPLQQQQHHHQEQQQQQQHLLASPGGFSGPMPDALPNEEEDESSLGEPSAGGHAR